MKAIRWSIILCVLAAWASVQCMAQDIPVNTEQQLEDLADATDEATEDDAYLQEMETFRKHPLNINIADADELAQLRILSELQIVHLIAYRKLFGKFLSIYELQAVPSLDVQTIKKIVPFISIESSALFSTELRKRFSHGEHSLLLRISQILEASKGYSQATTGSAYLGSPQRIYFRYRYAYSNLLQFGLLGDKDAGEQFFKGAQKNGFDFYSFHLFARKIGKITSLAIGDYTANLGQGLIQWQSLAFKKSADAMNIKKQSAILRPYNAAGEFYFFRGAGITLQKNKWSATVFVSRRKLSANFVADTLHDEDFVSSFQASGFHRTQNETADRNNLVQTTAGGNLGYHAASFQVGLNGIAYHFSLPIQKRNDPYNLFAISGKNWSNLSVDYSYTYHNLHVFGETAIDHRFHYALLHGLLISVDRRADLSFLYRTIQSAYQAVNGNAFTENTLPSNENGFYAGITIRPCIGWRIDAYADLFRFPWLKYQADAPSRGSDFLLQLTYTPNKQLEIYSRYKNKTKQVNQPANQTPVNYLVFVPRQDWRLQVSYKLNTAITLRNRVELLWYDKKGANSSTGFLGYIDILCKPLQKPYSGVIRLQYAETDDYNSRVYAYENDVLYSYSIPAFYDKGYRYYFSTGYDISRKLSCWLRWAQTVYQKKSIIGSGLDEISGKEKSELKFQLRFTF